MRLKCPACHAEFSLAAALDDEAGRQLTVLLADLPREVSRPLLAYAGLWRSATRALSWDRALRITREALALTADHAALAAALAETVEAMRVKQAEPGWKPLTSHNYLRRVLDSTTARSAGQALAVNGARPPVPTALARPPSTTLQGLAELERLRRGR